MTKVIKNPPTLHQLLPYRSTLQMRKILVLLFVFPLFAQNPCEDKFFVKISRDTKQDGALTTYMPEMSNEEFGYFNTKLTACMEKSPRLNKDGPRFKEYTKCISGNCVNGKGTLEYYHELWNYSKISWDFFPDKKYVGEFKDGKYDGLGVLVIDNPGDGADEKYEGEWKEGKKNGFGKQWRNNKLEYAGEWVNDWTEAKEIKAQLDRLQIAVKNILNPTNSQIEKIRIFVLGKEKGKKPKWQIISSPKVSNNQVSYTTSDIIEGRIDGDFEGWEGETIVKLMDGGIWQQTEYYYYYHYAYSPKVTIVKSGSSYKMKVDGVSKAVSVEKLN